MLSKYVNKEPRIEAAQQQAAAAKAVPKKRSERSHGGFIYRDVAFTYAVKGEKIVLHTWDKMTNSPNPGLVVPKAKKMQAVWAMARIVLAERELLDMGASPPEIA